VVGGLIAARRPQNPIGWLLLASALLVSIAQFAGQYAYYTLVTRPGSLPWGQAMLWLAGWPNNAGFVLVVFLLLLFPTGRLLSPRWRPVARFAAAAYIINVVGYAFAPGPQSSGPLPNPMGIRALADLALVAQAVATGLGLVAVLAAVASLLLRLRRAWGVERQQLKWFGYAAALFPVAVLVAVAFPSLGSDTVDGLIVVPALLALPAAIGIAVLRYRLYEIRSADQPHPGLWVADHPACGRLFRQRAGSRPGVRRGGRQPTELGCGGRHPDCGRPVPAGSPPGPGSRGPPVQPGTLRRGQDGGGVQRSTT
jgi:hypothetical protein